MDESLPRIKDMKYLTTVVILIVVLLLLAASDLHLLVFKNPDPEPKKELLVYCGITMIKPMSEIASIIERQHGVKISLIKGGSGNLLKSIKFNKLGDLFLPGSASYIKQSKAEGLVTESVHVGFNKAAMMVQKGNPRAVKPDLGELKDKSYYVVIGNPDSGSIGKETRKILTAAHIFDDVLNNARELTTDSKRLIEVLKKGEADLVINWYATSVWVENREYVDTLPIDKQYAQKKRLELGLLKSSKYPDVARKFMAFAASEEGNRIFEKYGLYNVEQ
jgi:molybdate transport system substrate-binding protein